MLGNRSLDRGDTLEVRAAYRWLNDDVRAPGLFEYLIDHGHEYPRSWLRRTCTGRRSRRRVAAPDRTVVLPCLHDEPTAALPVYDAMFRDSRGCWFLTEPEADFAEAVARAHRARGGRGRGRACPIDYDPDGFRARYGVDGPFVLYAGRRESGKGFDRLVERFAATAAHFPNPLRLVVAGPGPAPIPDEALPFVVDVGALVGARS